MKKTKVNLPTNKEIDEVLKAIEEGEKSGNTTEALPKDATVIELLKYQICGQIIRFKRKSNLSTQDLADLIEVPAPRVSEMLYKKIRLFSLDYLMGVLIKLSKHDKAILKKIEETVKVWG